MIQLPASLGEFREIHQRIRPYIIKTPVLQHEVLDELCGRQVFFKCENFQKIGAFKARGAVHAVLNLSDEQKKNGVATHSSGNHAQALAYAARHLGIKAFIVMPENSPEVKINGVKRLGGEVIFCSPGQKYREEKLAELVQKTGAFFVPPYNHEWVMAGQGTAALELLDETGELDYLLAPVGGGGLLSGTALAVQLLACGTKVIGCEPAAMDDASRSFQSGKLLTNAEDTTSVADGLRTNLGDITFNYIRQHVSAIFTVDEQEITEAMRLIWTHLKITAEASSAVALAVLLKHKDRMPGNRTGIIVSGGNVDLARLPFQ